LAHDFLEGRLSYADFSKPINAIPSLDDDEDVCELLYVIAHEPPGTPFVGATWWKLFKVTSREEREAEYRATAAKSGFGGQPSYVSWLASRSSPRKRASRR
jgi:hypothetical protein